MACTCAAKSAAVPTPCVCGVQSFTRVGADSCLNLSAALAPAVDFARDMQTRLGLRTYEVALVWTRWSGGERHRGEEYLLRYTPLLPTPRVSTLTELKREPTSAGLLELGELRVSELSPRLDEFTLRGGYDGAPTPPDVSFYWEVSTPLSTPIARRRFTLSSAPSYDAENLEWVVKLARTYPDRTDDPALAEG